MHLNSVSEAAQYLVDYYNANEIGVARGDEWAIIESYTVETKYGWIFNIDSKRYIETGDSLYRVLGIGGVVVHKDGSMHGTGNDGSWKLRIKAYEATTFPSPFRKLIAVLYLMREFFIK
jgi:hypothetical protein